MGVTEALLDGAQTRIRPILMTALTTILGLVPLALGLSEGALLSASLATVVIGGLVTSTLLTLIVIPVVYSLFMGARGRVSGDERPRHADEVPAADRPVERVSTTTATRPPVDLGAATTRPQRDLVADGAPPAAMGGGQLSAVRSFTSRAEAERARSYLSAAGLQADRLVVRPGATGRLHARGRLTRLAADWLRRQQPELLASGPTWELAGPPAVAATARTVLAGNGQVVDAPVADRP